MLLYKYSTNQFHREPIAFLTIRFTARLGFLLELSAIRSTYLEHHGKVRAIRSRPPEGGVPVATFFCPCSSVQALLSMFFCPCSSVHALLSMILCPSSFVQALTAAICALGL